MNVTIILLIKPTTENNFLIVLNKRISDSLHIISNTIIETEDRKMVVTPSLKQDRKGCFFLVSSLATL